jgi:transcriptional regulator with XRE-family HTH domain
MELGVRIAERLRVLGISQLELARRTNIAQSTINSLVKKPRRSSPHLLKIARELETTPAYLTGETDNPEAEFPDQHLTSEEIGWVQLLAAIEPRERTALLMLAESLAIRSGTGHTLHDQAREYRAG